MGQESQVDHQYLIMLQTSKRRKLFVDISSS